MEGKKIKVTQIRSTIGQSKKQRATMAALGLKKINHSLEHTMTPALAGMLAKVRHLISIE